MVLVGGRLAVIPVCVCRLLTVQAQRVSGPRSILGSGGSCCYVAMAFKATKQSISQHRHVKRGQDVQAGGKIGRWWPLLGRITDVESVLRVDIVLAPMLDVAGESPTRAVLARAASPDCGPPARSSNGCPTRPARVASEPWLEEQAT